ncbi:MAG: sigma-54-dependent Fis family transcriptional regulator [Calditrichaeota bacterium]|nr:MAG: sigma-54-dependent Fis family transcriptional regulator [Calditrichota bacterium]
MNRNKYPELPVLLVDDEPDFLNSAEITLAADGITHVVTLSDSRQVEEFLLVNSVSMIALDLNMPFISGRQLLPKIVRNHPGIPVIVITAVNEVDAAVEAMKNGAFDYLLKPVDDSRLLTAVRRSLEMGEVRAENVKLKEYLLSRKLKHPELFASIITMSPMMHAIFQYVEAIARTSLPVLITGETGSGKELIARSIHDLSERRGEFVAENVAGLDDHLFSDTLFGHKRGAFTGADRDRPGLIERASGGTLFLDEIGDLAVETQVKLLRLLQEKQFYPLGSDMPKLSDARIVVATLQNLEELAKNGTFRKDLYYRLQSHHIHLPPLRERKEDIPLLVNHFLEKAAAELIKKIPAFPKELLILLKNYSFPGNIRELEGMIFDALSRHQSGILALEPFREKIGIKSSQMLPSTQEVELNGFDLVFGDPLPNLKQVEELLIAEALRRADDNQTIAAQLLGLTRRALNNRLQRRKGEDDQ